ncbi:hypothetical protein EV421DRAFT_1805936 [Armillaria borealis]|uniref:F-box domain-containing protein n=1 Tax=Armillaria borealis TaxID=47425 RepID=A0AA39JIJ0_9AGAR|nr:hypothetical protein EV421DRAFT_1805936 [Armillaria borealis]
MDPTSVLPLEIVHKIFRHYLKDREVPVQSFDFSDGPWVLARVNSAWRSVSLTSKPLWSSINIIVIERRLHSAGLESTQLGSDVFQDDGDISLLISDASSPSNVDDEKTICIVPGDTANQILAEILHRSGNLSLDITISFPIVRHVPTTWTRFFSLLSTSSFRWTTLDLKAPNVLWEHFVGTTSAPASYPLLWNLRATVLESSSIITRIAGACPNVATLAFHHVVSGVVDAPEDPILMLSLRRLESNCSRILKVITAPALNYLSLRRSRLVQEPEALSEAFILSFLIRSQCSELTNVELLWWGNLENAVDMLSHIPTLRSLSINFNFKESFFITMKSPSSFLPQLRKLKLGGHCRDATWDSNIVLDMVESRIADGMLQSVDIGPISIERGSVSQPRLDALNAVPNVCIKFSDRFRFTILSGGDFGGGVLYML